MNTNSNIQQETRHISCTETAKLIRKELKNNFPGIKFSVRSDSYSMGASIRVEWMDGPTTDEVGAVTKKFQGASFDASIDLKEYHDSEYNGKKVHFGADYVFTDRLLSESFLTKVTMWYCKRFGYQMPVIAVSSYNNSAHIDGDYYVPQANEWLGTLLYREHRQISEKDVDDIDGFFARIEAEKEAAYQAYLAEEAARKQTSLEKDYLITVVEVVSDNQKRIRILLPGADTSFKMLITGELAYYLEKFDAVLVSAEDFDTALDIRTALHEAA